MSGKQCPRCGASLKRRNLTHDGLGYNDTYECDSHYQFYNDGTLHRVLHESRMHLPSESNCPNCNSELMLDQSIIGRWKCGSWRANNGELRVTAKCRHSKERDARWLQVLADLIHSLVGVGDFGTDKMDPYDYLVGAGCTQDEANQVCAWADHD